MKVYTSYEIPNVEGFEPLENLASASMQHMMKYQKYRTMWQLRSLENEINEDGGMIIIKSTGRIEIKGFRSQDLVDKIKEILAADLD